MYGFHFFTGPNHMLLPKQLKDKQPYKDDSDKKKKKKKKKNLVNFVVVFDENSRSMTRM